MPNDPYAGLWLPRGVVVRELTTFQDDRGWLMELFRSDECNPYLFPEMGYVSETKDGYVRGPHEHEHQTDCFVFLGDFTLYLWENRGLDYPRYRERLEVSIYPRTLVYVPPGIVHAYRNREDRSAFVLNFPNRLYKGPKRARPVDEIRWEANATSPFVVG